MPRAAVVLAAEEEVLGEGLHRGDAAIEPQIGWRAVTAVVDRGAGELAGRRSQRRKPEVLGREPAALDGSDTNPTGSEISAQELGRPGDVRAAVFEPSTAQELTEPEARWARLTDRTSGAHEDGQLAEDSSAMTQEDVLERSQLDRAQSRRGGSEAPLGDAAGIDARAPLDLGSGRLGWEGRERQTPRRRLLSDGRLRMPHTLNRPVRMKNQLQSRLSFSSMSPS